MDIAFFQTTSDLWVHIDKNGFEMYYPNSSCRLYIRENKVTLIRLVEQFTFIDNIPVTSIRKSEALDDFYTSKSEFLTVVAPFLKVETISTQIVDANIISSNGSKLGTLFGDDVKTITRKAASSGNWVHGLPAYAVDVTLTGGSKWYVLPDENDSQYFDGVSVFELGTASDAKLFISSKGLNRYENGYLSYFLFTKALKGLLQADGDFEVFIGAVLRGLESDGQFGQIKDGVLIGYKRVNGILHHYYRTVKNFVAVDIDINGGYDASIIETLQIHRLEIGYLGIHPALDYRVDQSELSNKLEHVYTYNMDKTSVACPNLAVGVYMMNHGNTQPIQIRNGSLNYGNYTDRDTPDSSSRNIIDEIYFSSVVSGEDTILACYTVPEKAQMYKEINEAGGVVGSFRNTVSNILKSINGSVTSNKEVQLNVYLVPKSDVIATYTPLNPYINVLERAVGAQITSVDLSNGAKIASLSDLRAIRGSIDIEKERHLLTASFVGVITCTNAQSVTDLEIIINTDDLF